MITDNEMKIMELYPIVFPASAARELSSALGPSNFDQAIAAIYRAAIDGFNWITVDKNMLDNFCISILRQLGYEIYLQNEEWKIEW